MTTRESTLLFLSKRLPKREKRAPEELAPEIQARLKNWAWATPREGEPEDDLALTEGTEVEIPQPESQEEAGDGTAVVLEADALSAKDVDPDEEKRIAAALSERNHKAAEAARRAREGVDTSANGHADPDSAARAELETLAAEKAELERLAAEEAERQRVAAEKAEQERLAAEEAERQRIAAEKAEQERIPAEKAERERIAAEKAEQERLAAEEAERQRVAAEKAEEERIAAEKAERERIAAEKAEQERLAAEEAERQRIAAEKAEEERIAAEKAEQERIAAEKAEQERLAAERAEQERIAAEKAEQERIAAEKAEQERIAAEKAEQERLAAEEAERQRVAAEKAEEERIAAEKAERERIAAEKAEQERLAAEEAERQRIAAEKAEQERIAAEKAEQARIAAEKAEQERLAAEEAERQRVAAEKAEEERIAAEKAERVRVAAEAKEAKRAVAEEAKQERLAAQRAEQERKATEKAEKARVAAEEKERKRVAIEARKQEQLAAKERLTAEIAEAERLATEDREAGAETVYVGLGADRPEDGSRAESGSAPVEPGNESSQAEGAGIGKSRTARRRAKRAARIAATTVAVDTEEVESGKSDNESPPENSEVEEAAGDSDRTEDNDHNSPGRPVGPLGLLGRLKRPGVEWLPEARPQPSGLGHSVVFNVGLTIIGLISAGLVPFGFNIVVGRVYGPAQLGALSIALSLALFLGQIPGTISGAATKFIAESLGRGDEENARDVFQFLLTVAVLSGVAFAIGLLIFSVRIESMFHIGFVTVALAAILIPTYTLYLYFKSVYYGIQDVPSYLKIEIISDVAFFGVLLTVMLLGASPWLLLPFGLNNAIFAGLAIRDLQSWFRAYSFKGRCNRAAVLKFCVINGSGTAASLGRWALGTVIAGLFLSHHDVGMFAAAVAITAPFPLLPRAISLVTFSMMARLHGAGQSDSVRLLLDQSTEWLVFLLGIPCGLAILNAGHLMSIVFGSEYAVAAPAAALIIAGAYITDISRPSIDALSSTEYVRIPTAASFTGLGVSVAMWVTLIPLFGITMAGLGFAFGALVTGGIPAYYAYRYIGSRKEVFLRPAIMLVAVMVLVGFARLSDILASLMFLAVMLYLYRHLVRQLLSLAAASLRTSRPQLVKKSA